MFKAQKGLFAWYLVVLLAWSEAWRWSCKQGWDPWYLGRIDKKGIFWVKLRVGQKVFGNRNRNTRDLNGSISWFFLGDFRIFMRSLLVPLSKWHRALLVDLRTNMASLWAWVTSVWKLVSALATLHKVYLMIWTRRSRKWKWEVCLNCLSFLIFCVKGSPEEHWPKWLPKVPGWRIAYFKEEGHVKVCYISPKGDRCLSRSEVKFLGHGRSVEVFQNVSFWCLAYVHSRHLHQWKNV